MVLTIDVYVTTTLKNVFLLLFNYAEESNIGVSERVEIINARQSGHLLHL